MGIRDLKGFRVQPPTDQQPILQLIVKSAFLELNNALFAAISRRQSNSQEVFDEVENLYDTGRNDIRSLGFDLDDVLSEVDSLLVKLQERGPAQDASGPSQVLPGQAPAILAEEDRPSITTEGSETSKSSSEEERLIQQNAELNKTLQSLIAAIQYMIDQVAFLANQLEPLAEEDAERFGRHLERTRSDFEQMQSLEKELQKIESEVKDSRPAPARLTKLLKTLERYRLKMAALKAQAVKASKAVKEHTLEELTGNKSGTPVVRKPAGPRLLNGRWVRFINGVAIPAEPPAAVLKDLSSSQCSLNTDNSLGDISTCASLFGSDTLPRDERVSSLLGDEAPRVLRVVPEALQRAMLMEEFVFSMRSIPKVHPISQKIDERVYYHER